jgi:hypothetical protein
MEKAGRARAEGNFEVTCVSRMTAVFSSVASQLS